MSAATQHDMADRKSLPDSLDSDAVQMQNLGYKQSLGRRWHFAESFAASFCSLNFLGGTRSLFFLGILAGGPLAMWSMTLASIFFMTTTAAVLAEICSAIPLSGSIYIWAAEAAGSRYGRLIGFTVAWWACVAWMTFAAGNCQTTANYILSLLYVYDVDFPGGLGVDNVKFRVLVWGVSEGLLLLVVALNYLPQKTYSWVFKGSGMLMAVDFVICIIWLPIGASRSYGIRTASEALLTTHNGTGHVPGWNWLLVLIYATGNLIGFDASGHVAEETVDASRVAARGIFWSALSSGTCAFAATILWLFVTPDIATWETLTAPQPFVQVYALAFGKGGATFMTILAVAGLILNTSIAIVAASRLIFAVARDGVLPGSSWIGQVTPDGRPKNAVTVFLVFGSLLLCTILPSSVAFTSLVSAGAVPTISAYALIPICRALFTSGRFQHTKFSLGRLAFPCYIVAASFNLLLFAVLISPFSWPVSAATFNYAPVIWFAACLAGWASWALIPSENWLRQDLIVHMDDGANAADSPR